MRRVLYLLKQGLGIGLCLCIWLVGSPAAATDTPAGTSILSDSGARMICPDVCGAVECGWNGLWHQTDDGSESFCECGTRRVRHIPGGNIRSNEVAAWACPEVCTLQGDTWDGTWETIPGAYTVCGCAYVAEYCPGADPNNAEKNLKPAGDAPAGTDQ